MTRNQSIPIGPALLALVTGLVYAPVILGLFRDWMDDPNYSHGFLVPVVSGVLMWQRRGDLAALPLRPANIGLLGIVAACGMLVAGAAGAEVFTQRVSGVVLLASAAVYLRGWAWLRVSAFPIAFLLLAIPMPYVIYYGLTTPLQGLAAKTAGVALNGIGILMIREGNIIHLPGTSLEVAEACSGIRSLYAFLALGALLARSLPIPYYAKWLVFLATVPLSVVGNAFRVFGTGVGVHLVGPAAAEGVVHESFGLIIFSVALVFLFLLGKGARSVWHSAS